MPASPPLPPENARLLSDWGMRRGRRTGEERMHAGMDLGHTGGRGVPILNVQRGVVHEVLTDDDRRRAYSGYGNGVIVHHPDDDTWALYAHMDRVDVAEGQPVEAGQQLGTMGNSSNRKFPGMGVHLHIELRQRRRNGQPPFPGPYPRSVEVPFNNLDPRPWLESKGLRFGSRGSFEVEPGTAMAMTRPMWENLGQLAGVDPYPDRRLAPWSGRRWPETALAGVAGVDPYPERRIAPWGNERLFPETSMAGLGKTLSPADGATAETHPYEPVARFDRDVRFGLTPVEWAAIGAGTLVVTGTIVAVVVRRKLVRPNRRRRRTSRVV